jgi:hypothetical protein
MKRAGGCRCGAVRFTVAGPPARVGICHCADCRKFGGSAFSFFAIWPISAYEATGTTETFEGRSFCPKCGSRVTSLSADEAEVMVGSLDEAPSDLAPEYELWIKRREGWMQRLPWADQFNEDRTESAGDWRQARQAD